MPYDQSESEETEALGADASGMAEPEAVGSVSAGAVAPSSAAEPIAPETSETSGSAPAEVEAEPAQGESAAESAPEPQAEAETTPEPQVEAAAESAPEPQVEAATVPEPETGLKRGELVEAIILETSSMSVKVQLGEHGEGIIPSGELDRMNRKALEALKVGMPITVLVVNPRVKEGGALVSINRAEEELDWQRAENFKVSQEVYETRIAGYNKGGLIVKFGRLRGFVPQSQMNAERRRSDDTETAETRWGKMVNEPIVVKVMEVDKSRNRLILSERSAARESREKRKETLISQLTVGETRTGRVVSLEDFGAFIDIGGAEGLVHTTELSWHHVTHPRQFLEIGQSIEVRVISVDPVAKRIGLSLKALEMDPWDRVATEYNTGQLVKAKVTKLTKFGAFAEIEGLPEIEGLIHISELSDRRVTHPKEVVNEGDDLTLRIVKMDIAGRRLGLSLKKVNSPEYLDSDWDLEEGNGAPEAPAEPEAPEAVADADAADDAAASGGPEAAE